MTTDMIRLFFALMVIIALGFSADAQTSRNGDFTAKVSRTAPAKNKRNHNTWTASIVDRQGRTVYKIVKQVAFDVQYPAIYLFDDGSSILVSAFAGELAFYNNTGNPGKTLQLFGRSTTEYEQVVKCSVSGNRAAVLYSTPEQANATVLMLDLHSNELWRMTLSGKNAGEVFISNDGQSVAAGSYDVEKNNFRMTETFDASGKALRAFNMLFRYSDIADDGRIALADRDNMVLASLRGGDSSVKWSKSSGDLITGVRFVDGFVAVVSESVNLPKGSPVYTDPSLVILDMKGKKIRGTQLHTSSSTAAAVIVDGRNIILKSSSSQASISRSSLKQN